MPFDLADAIKSVGEAFTSLFNYFKTAKSVQSETEVIKDKHKAEEANNIAEDIFLLVDKCRNGFSDDDWNEYLKLKKKFNNKD